jgi:hypothetical protein
MNLRQLLLQLLQEEGLLSAEQGSRDPVVRKVGKAFRTRSDDDESLFSPAMQSRVTATAECDQVLFGIFPGMTPKFLMVNMEIPERSAGWASPSIALKNRSA